MPNALAQGEIRSRPVGPREGIVRFFERILGDNRAARDKAETITGALETVTPVGTVNAAYDLPGQAAEAIRNPSVQSGLAAALTAGSLIPFANPLAKAARGAAKDAGRTAGAFKVYHASPYDFERFDSSRIGTGEGAHVPSLVGEKGHGLYFAGDEDEMEGYHKAFKALTGDAKRYEVEVDADPEDFAQWETLSDDMKAAVKDPKLVEEMKAEGIPGVSHVIPGRFNNQELRDWQDHVHGYDMAYHSPGGRWRDYKYDPELHQQAKDHVARLLEGIKNQRNYVVFDDNILKIARKYGILPGALGAAAVSGGGEEPTQY